MTIKKPVHRTVWAPVAFLAALALPAQTGAEEVQRPGAWHFNLRAETEVKYDDNILSLSSNEKNQLKDPALANSDRFRISSADDVIVAPEVALNFGRAVGRGPETNIMLTLRAYEYTTNSVKNFQQYALAVRQELHRSHVHSTALTVGGSYIPSYYLRQLVDDDESALAGTTIRNSADYSLQQAFIEVTQELVDRTLSVAARYTHESRDYNDHFNERDSTSGVASIEFNVYPVHNNHLRLRPYIEREQRDADGDVPTTAVVDDDTGFDSGIYGLEARWLWGPDSGHRQTFRTWIEKEDRTFNTTNSADTGHFDRQDSITQYGLGYDRDLGPAWKLRFSYRHRTNDVSTVSGTTPFTKNVASAVLVYSFDSSTRRAGKRP